MKVSFDSTRKHAFNLRLDDLWKIWELLEEQVGTVKVSVRCSDDMVRTFDTWKELVSYDNPPTKKIIGLSIDACSDDSKKSVNVHFSYIRLEDIYITNKAPEQVILVLKDKIYDILDGTKPWYSVLARVNSLFYYIFFPISIVSFYAIVLVIKEPIVVLPEENPFRLLLAVSTILVLITMLTAVAMKKIWCWLFPESCYSLG